MENPIYLNQKNLAKLKNALSIPTYDRSQLKTGIVHIGIGGFHRAHQAVYTQQLLTQWKEKDWGICGIGLRESDRKMATILKRQDYLYTLMVKHPNGTQENQIIGSLTDFILGVDYPEKVINKMAHRETKIISLTITEGGYNFNPSTGEFDFGNPDIQKELEHPKHPKTVYGFLTAALRKRRDTGIPAFTILSCDNIQHNGAVTRKMVLAFAEKQDPELAAWIEKEVCFPNTMVDRITPVTKAVDINDLCKTVGIIDDWPVTCEPFIQWVVEDKFSNGRPPFEKVGVQFVSDVTPYEKMKIRLLNAGHSVIGILGAIHGHQTINDCMEDPTFAIYLRKFMDEEATPVLDEVKGIDLEKYKDSLEERFRNPNIKDSVSRICSESSAKLPKFLIPTIQENLAQGGSIKYATLVIAAWCYYSDKGVDKNGQTLEVIDVLKEELQEAAQKTVTDPLAFLRQEALFGQLIQNERFTTLYAEMQQRIYKEEDVGKYLRELI